MKTSRETIHAFVKIGYNGDGFTCVGMSHVYFLLSKLINRYLKNPTEALHRLLVVITVKHYRIILLRLQIHHTIVKMRIKKAIEPRPPMMMEPM